MRLTDISEAKPPGFNYINTGGRRNLDLEPSLEQKPHRDWKNTSRLPSLKKLRYAAQLTERWIEFEQNDLPRIVKLLNNTAGLSQTNPYLKRKFHVPAMRYLTSYFLNTGCPIPALIRDLLPETEVDWRPTERIPEDYYAL